jgi:hypothetical protein
MCIDFLRRFSNAVRMKRPEKRRTKTWILFHDNAFNTPIRSDQGFLSKELYDSTVASPILF